MDEIGLILVDTLRKKSVEIALYFLSCAATAHRVLFPYERRGQYKHVRALRRRFFLCHFDPFDNAQGRLREKSLFRARREILS